MSYLIANKIFGSKSEAEEFYDETAEEILREAISLTPIKTGVLVNSYRVGRFGSEPNEVYITNTCDYAVFVHELIFNFHENGQPKFLEDASWIVGSQYGVKTSMDVFPVTPANETAQAITCYLDYGEAGYDVEDRRRKAQVLFARYFKWRCEIRRAKIEKILKQAEVNAEDVIKLNSLRNRDAYEKLVYPIYMGAFKQWRDSVAGTLGKIGQGERFVVPLSKIYSPTPYSNAVLDFSKHYEEWLIDVVIKKPDILNGGYTGGIISRDPEFDKYLKELLNAIPELIAGMEKISEEIARKQNKYDIKEELTKAIKQINSELYRHYDEVREELIKEAKEHNKDIEKVNDIEHEIRMGNEKVISQIESMEGEYKDYSKRTAFNKKIDDLLNIPQYETAYFDLDTGRFKGGALNIPKYGSLKIKTFRSGDTTEKWEDVE